MEVTTEAHSFYGKSTREDRGGGGAKQVKRREEIERGGRGEGSSFPS